MTCADRWPFSGVSPMISGVRQEGYETIVTYTLGMTFRYSC
jgi:hypothetical protein